MSENRNQARRVERILRNFKGAPEQLKIDYGWLPVLVRSGNWRGGSNNPQAAIGIVGYFSRWSIAPGSYSEGGVSVVGGANGIT